MAEKTAPKASKKAGRARNPALVSGTRRRAGSSGPRQELAASRDEELQSANEELVALNGQLRSRNSQLAELSNDLTSVLSGIDLPVVILGPDRRIRRFTPPAGKLLGLRPGDAGRQIGSLPIAIHIPDLEGLISAAIDEGSEGVRELKIDSGRWNLLRVRPFRADGRIEGVLLAFQDIHELRQHQEAIQKERNFISAILDSARDLLVLVLDHEGRIVHFNQVCQQRTGYSLDEVRGRFVWDVLLAPGEADLVKEAFREVASGSPGHRERYWIAKDGRRLLINWSSNVVMTGGELTSVIATGIDVTERQEAELLAKQAQMEYRDQLAAEVSALVRLREASDRLWQSHNRDDGLKEMVDAGVALLGADMGNIRLLDESKHVLRIVAHSGFSPEFLENFGEVSAADAPAWRRSLRSGERTIVEDVQADPEFAPRRTIVAAAGFRAVQSTPLIDRNGRLIGIFSTYFRNPHRPSENDLRRFDLYAQRAADFIERLNSEELRRRSEATLRTLLETAAQAILAVDREGHIVLTNVTAEQMFGYSRDQLIGRSIEYLLPEHFRTRHGHHRAGWFAEPHNRPMGIGLDLAGRRRDGSEFPIEVSLSHIGTNDVTLGVAFVSDITERRNQERTLLEYKDQLQKLTGALLSAQESANRELARELHDVVSQELAAVGMEISWLKEKLKADSDLRGRLAELGKRIGQLSADIHRTSRELHPAVLEELGIEAAMQQECDAFARRTAIDTLFTLRDVPAEIRGSLALCLYRVTQEGLRNVHKHSKSPRVRVHLEGTKDNITLRIEDEGDGFDLVQAARKGGLGLVSMEERVRLENGHLTVESKPGVGTTVTVIVPLEGTPK